MAIRAGISARVPFVWIQLIKESALSNFFEGRQLHAVEIRHQLFKTAVGKFTEICLCFKRQLRRHDSVVYRLLNDDAVLVEEHCFKCKVVRYLDDALALKKSACQIRHHYINIRIRSAAVAERNIYACAFLHREGYSGYAGFVCIQRGERFLAVCFICGGFKVEGYDICVSDIFFNVRNAADCFIVLHIISLYRWGGSEPPPHHQTYSASVISTRPANALHCSVMALMHFCSSAFSILSALHTT